MSQTEQRALRAKIRVGLPIALALVAAGCSSPTAEVTGRVEYTDGTPIVAAVKTITFRPTEESTAKVKQAATGFIQEDGSFFMYTRKPGDGVQKGSYAVTFNILKDPNYGGYLVNERYSAASTTPIQLEVTENVDDLVFQVEKP